MSTHIKRRTLLTGAVFSILSSRMDAAKHREELGDPNAFLHSSTLVALLDTIVPEDDLPGALEIGFENKLQSVLTAHPKWHEQMLLLAEKINFQALDGYALPFHRLALGDRESLVDGILSDLNIGEVRVHLKSLRNSVILLYYETEIGRRSLGYTLPASYPAYTSA